MIDVGEILRYVNIGLAVLCLLLMWWQFHVWRRLPVPWRVVGLAMGALVMATAIAAVENLAAHNPPGLRVPLTTIALGWLVYGLRRAHRTTHGEEQR